MPELDCISAFATIVNKFRKQHESDFKSPLIGRLQINPRVFATGTQKKPWNSCFVQHFGYREDLEPNTEDMEPHLHDVRRCKGAKGEAWRGYIERELEEGEVCVRARGKELILAAGYHAMRVHFGLEAHLAHLRRDEYERIMLQDCAGSNPNKAKREKMRSFIVPPDLTVGDARQLDKTQTLEVFGAIVCEHDVFVILDFARIVILNIISLDRHWRPDDFSSTSELWPRIWGEGYGPDWTYEVDAAETALDLWREEVLQHADVEIEDALVEMMCARQDIFNGYGRHTAHDLLFWLHAWPAMPPSVLCSNDDLYRRFKVLLHNYAALFVSKQYEVDCIGIPNSGSPLAFNVKSDDNYIGKYVQVYRKWNVRIPAHEYNELYMDGALDPEHTLGEPYQWSEDLLCRGKFRKVQVRLHVVGGNKWYTVIRAQRPSNWKYSCPGQGALVTDDVRLSGMSTTLGPASFYNYKQNQYDSRLRGQPGRPAKVHTGRRGRPARRPKIDAVRRKAKRTRLGLEKARAAELCTEGEDTDRSMTEGEEEEEEEEGEEECLVEAERPPKRSKAGGSLESTAYRRVTRSMA